MANGLMPVDDRAAREIAEMLPADLKQAVNLAVIKQGFLRNKSGDIYIRRPGLLMFMEMKFRGKARYSIKVVPPTVEEEERFRRMLGVKEGEKFAVMKGAVEIEYEDGKKEVFEDFGTATPEDTYHGRLLEMATARATNRAMRLATSLGFTSAEELPHQERRAEQAIRVEAKADYADDTPFEKLPKGKQIEILTNTDKLFKELSNLESDFRGEDVTKEQVKAEILNKYFGVSSRKELTYGELKTLWNVLKSEIKRLKEELSGIEV